MPVTRAPKRISSPCFLKTLAASLAIWPSTAGKKLSSASSNTTLLPRRAQTLPSSRPITPAPITPSLPGTDWNSRAPVESTIISWSTGAGGMATGTEPAAIIIFSASKIDTVPSAAVTSTFLPANTFPAPSIVVTPLAWNKPPMPPIICATTPSLRLIMAGTSIVTSPVPIPWTPSASLASWYL